VNILLWLWSQALTGHQQQDEQSMQRNHCQGKKPAHGEV
jgi:hypothetical protein